MDEDLSLTGFNAYFSSEDKCLEEIKRLRYRGGVNCSKCNKITRHYKLAHRPVYCCKKCRQQVSPLANTLFEKSTTPLRIWFYALFLMTHSKSNISIRQLQKELSVTYKTAWRIYNRIHKLMEQNNGDLLAEKKVSKWVFFNQIELKVVRKTPNI